MNPQKATDLARITAGIEDERAMAAGHSIELIRGMRIGLATGAAACRLMGAMRLAGAILMIVAMGSTAAAVNAWEELSRIRAMPFEDAVEVLQRTYSDEEARAAVEVVRVKVSKALAELRRVERMMPAAYASNALELIATEASR